MTIHDRISIVDECHAVLYRAGWSTGDTKAILPTGTVWQVYAHRREHRIVTRAPSQALAWLLAWRQARRLG